MLTLNGHTQGVSSVAWSPKGDHLASASMDETIVVWDAVSGAEVLKEKNLKAAEKAQAAEKAKREAEEILEQSLRQPFLPSSCKLSSAGETELVVINSRVQLHVNLRDGYGRPIRDVAYRNTLAKRLTLFEGGKPWEGEDEVLFSSGANDVVSCQVPLTSARDYEFSVRCFCNTEDEQQVGAFVKVKAVLPPCPRKSRLSLSVQAEQDGPDHAHATTSAPLQKHTATLAGQRIRLNLALEEIRDESGEASLLLPQQAWRLLQESLVLAHQGPGESMVAYIRLEDDCTRLLERQLLVPVTFPLQEAGLHSIQLKLKGSVPQGEREVLDEVKVLVEPGTPVSAVAMDPKALEIKVGSDSELFSTTVTIKNQYGLEVACDVLQVRFLAACEEAGGAGFSAGASRELIGMAEEEADGTGARWKLTLCKEVLMPVGNTSWSSL